MEKKMSQQKQIEEPSIYILDDGDLLKEDEINSAIIRVSKITLKNEWTRVFNSRFYVSSQLLKSELNAILNN
jgi:hypothetical protein